jgi:hypothetical protein
MGVDEFWGHRETLGVDLLPPALVEPPDPSDSSAPDSKVGPVRREPRAVDDDAVANDKVKRHERRSSLSPTLLVAAPP